MKNCIGSVICLFFSRMNLELALLLLLTLLFISYGTIHVYAMVGLSRLPARQRELSQSQAGISVIIAARNEESNIGRCLQSLVGQKYPTELFEVIVVDDRSTDGTAAIVRNYRQRYPFVRLVEIASVASDLPPKKNALNEGIKQSGCDILAFTDADCIAPEEWLGNLAAHFLPDVGLVAGYSPIEQQFPGTYLSRWADAFLRYLEIKNSFGAAASIGLDAAYLCTGRNLAYRREVFREVGGFERIKHSVSGDDDLFIQLVQRHTRWKIRYLLSPQSHVETKPPASFSDFLAQRKRHFSAGRYYPPPMKTIFALIHSYNALVLLTLFIYPLWGVIGFAAKLIIDGLVFRLGSSFFGKKRLLRFLVPLELESVLYNLFIGPLGYFGRISWKGHKS